MEKTEQTQVVGFSVNQPVNADQARAIATVQAEVIAAKRFPRDENRAYTKIMESCKIVGLAMKACYAYPKGKNEDGSSNIVRGPSIRLAEALVSAWGNLSAGFEIIHEDAALGYSDVVSFCWDKESNNRYERKFRVSHKRKAGGKLYMLTDPRDIYEKVANEAQRRVRACILAAVPFYVVEDAVVQADNTLRDPAKHGTPAERTRKMLTLFKGVGVTQEMVEKRLGHPSANNTHDDIAALIIVYNTISDDTSKIGDFFDIPKPEKPLSDTSDLNDAMKKEAEEEAARDAENNKRVEEEEAAWMLREQQKRLEAETGKKVVVSPTESRKQPKEQPTTPPVEVRPGVNPRSVIKRHSPILLDKNKG
jgi:hypothetical protein